MGRYVAFLRGMNIGGRRIKNDELRLPFEKLGFEDVATFRASGNVIFRVEKDGDPDALAAGIEAELGETLGYEVPVFLRTAPELLKMSAFEPFDPPLVEASAGKLQVSLLIEKPAAKVRKEILAMATDDDLLTFGGRELYWLPSGGMLDSDLDLKTIDALLGLSTRRTKGTIDQIAARHFA